MRIVSGLSALGFGVGLVLLHAPSALAGDQILRGEPPSWVAPAGAAAEPPSSPEAAQGARFLLFDTQFRAEPDGEAVYLRYRALALTPQALPVVGAVAVNWNPASQDVTVHQVHVIRDGQIIDVLADQSFETLRREENLQQAMLDGQLTAVLQPAGLRVGDVLDVAYTVVSKDPITADRPEQVADLNMPIPIDQVRYRASWPSALPVRLRAMDDWTPLEVRRQGGQSSVEIRRENFEPVIVPDDVPIRMRYPRRIEISAYRDWGEIAARLKPLYDRTRRIEPGSPLQAEIERIRSLSDDPAVQAAAALRLVQDQIRYVALLMGEGALTPATADETWRQRFGDCKAKTTLLLALLDGLGIEAEPAAVNLLLGDGMDAGLPRIGAFNHVIVRATIAGSVYWLDGARTGDRALADLAVPTYRWALPLTGADAKLEPLEVAPRTTPDSETRIDMDASAGLYTPAKVTGATILSGDAAASLGAQLALMPGAQKDQGLRGLWDGWFNDLTVSEVGSVYDTEANRLTLTMTGTVPLSWGADGLLPPGSTYPAFSAEKRPEGPFQSAPYLLTHPAYLRQVSTLKLPANGEGFRVSGGEFDRTELGHHLKRTVSLDGDLMTVQIDIRSLVNEISAEEAERSRVAAEARPFSPPRIFSSNYRPSEADRAAWTASEPTTAEAWLDRAQALHGAENNAGAVQAADRAVELAPENSATWANRGVYRFWNNDREGAAEDLEKAVDIDPSERIAMNGHALLAMAERRYDDAVIELSRALRQAPGDPFALAMRAQLYLSLRQPDRALRDMDALIAASPGQIRLKMMRAGVLQQANRMEEAEAEIDVVAAALPEEAEVLGLQADLKLKRGKAQEASDILDRLIPLLPPPAVSALMLRASASAALGRLDRAAEDLATARSRATSATALNNLCWTAGTAGILLDQALKDCDAALALSPGAAHILDSRGRVLLQQGEIDAALQAYETALADAPTQAASLYGRGLARIAKGEVETGEADKAAALAIDPTVAESFTQYHPPETSPAT